MHVATTHPRHNNSNKMHLKRYKNYGHICYVFKGLYKYLKCFWMIFDVLKCFWIVFESIWKYSNVWPFSRFSWQLRQTPSNNLTNKRHTLLSNKMPYQNISLIWMITRGMVNMVMIWRAFVSLAVSRTLKTEL